MTELEQAGYAVAVAASELITFTSDNGEPDPIIKDSAAKARQARANLAESVQALRSVLPAEHPDSTAADDRMGH